MRLKYYEKEINFGDALNPYIFNSLLPGFFNQSEDIDFFGIGSIIGFDIMTESTAKKKIIFSSGLGYAEPPILDSSYDVMCVRGPLTAKKLKIDNKYAITDGAALVAKIYTETCPKKYACSFMPHHKSEEIFDWEKICDHIGINYISPCGDPLQGLKQINESRLIITEAMHGAIVADALRVPWIPIKIYKHINEFKWKDWMCSLNIDHNFMKLPRMFKREILNTKIKQSKIGYFLKEKHRENIIDFFTVYQERILYQETIKTLEKLSKKLGYLSNEKILFQKISQLERKLYSLQEKYGR